MSLENPLNDKEFHELDRFLLSEQCPDDAMTMDTLHGFLTAIVIGPEDIPMAEWLPLVWGNDPGQTPRSSPARRKTRIINLIPAFHDGIRDHVRGGTQGIRAAVLRA